MTASVTPAPPIKPIDLSFLEENAPDKNLSRLANPKLSSAPLTSCLTKTVYKKTPYFKPSRETIQAYTIGGTLGMAVFRVASQVFWGTGFCVAAKPQWFENFFSNSSECFGQTIENMTTTGSLRILFIQTSVIGLCGIGAYLAARVFLKDYHETSRLQMLGKEYFAIAESLAKGFENARKENNPEALKTIQGFA